MVMPLYLEAAGAISSVGLSAPQTLAAMRAGLEGVELLPYLGRGGQELLASPTPLLAQGLSPEERLTVLSALALTECASGDTQEAPIAVLVVGSEAIKDRHRFLNGLQDQLPFHLDFEASDLFSLGSSALVDAFTHARSLLQTKTAVYVVAVDTLLTLDQIRRLDAAGKIYSEKNSDGFTPGEAAVAIRVSSRASQGTWALISGAVAASEPSFETKDETNLSQGMSCALRGALAESGATAEELMLLVNNASGQKTDFDELSLAAVRVLVRRGPEPTSMSVAEAVGHTGAASGLLSCLLAAFLLKHRFVESTKAMAMILGDDTERRAAVVLEAVNHG